MKKLLAILLIAAMVFSFAACGEKETGSDEKKITWPERDVTVLIPNATGSPVDLSARVFLDYLSQKTGVSFVVENNDTGHGALIAEQVYNADPDGYTLMIDGIGSEISYYTGTWSHQLTKDYKIIASSVGQYAGMTGVVVCGKDKPYKTWDEFVQYVNDNPDKVTVANATGTAHEIRIKLVFDYFGLTDKVHWVSGATQEAITGVMGGNIDVGFIPTSNVGPYLEDGSFVGLLTASVERNYPESMKKVLDGIPVLSDVTDKPEELVFWSPIILFGPKDIPDELAEYINSLTVGLKDDAAYMERILALGPTNTYPYMSCSELKTLFDTEGLKVKQIMTK